jgi:hypothetical protein
MIQLRTLANKLTFTKPNGDVVLDLVRRAVSFLNIKAAVGQYYRVNEETVMRPDLISNYFYGSSNYLDLLLKYNGYSNPFAVDINDIFRIPDSDTLNKFGAQPNLSDLGASRKKRANVVFAPKSKKDQRRIDYLLKKANAGGLGGGGLGAPPVPPNVALDNGVKIANGQIVFGSDVTNVKKEDCPDPISRTKLKETLLKNRIGG